MKSILLIFIIIFLVILETSWAFLPQEVCFVFILIIVLLIKSIEDRSLSAGFGPKHVYLMSIFGGILLDLYSIFPPGLYFLSLFITTYICYKFVLPRFNLTGPLNILIICIIASLIYQFFLVFIGYLFYVLGFSNIKIIFDKFYFSNIIWFVVLNSILILISFFIIKRVKQTYV